MSETSGEYGGYECPNCGRNDSVEADRIQFGGDEISEHRECHCKNCGATWMEEIRIVAYSGLKADVVQPPDEPTVRVRVEKELERMRICRAKALDANCEISAVYFKGQIVALKWVNTLLADAEDE